MFDYLQKFNSLPKSLRDKVSSASAMRVVASLEDKYKVSLAAVVMKVMAKTINIKELSEYFVNEFQLSPERASALKNEMVSTVFATVSDYLGIEVDKNISVTDFSNIFINKAGISLPSEDLYIRLRNIILTYRKGVRNKMDTKASLMKEPKFGGLGLISEDADKILKIVSELENQGLDSAKKELNNEKSPQEIRQNINNDKPLLGKNDLNKFGGSKEKLDKIIMNAESGSLPFYEIKKSLPQSQKVEALEEKEAQELLPKEKENSFLPINKDKDKDKDKEKNIEEKIVVEDKKDNDEKVKEVNKIENKVEKEDKALVSDDIEKVSTEKISQNIPLKPDNGNKEIEKIEEIKTESRDDQVFANQLKPKFDVFEKKQSSPEVVAEKTKTESVKEEKVEKTAEKEQVPTAQININLKRPAPSTQKPRLDDIKPVRRVMSPIDELRFLNTTTFRRLAEKPDDIVLKIFNKIKLLERDGYDKMVEGVKAWRQSEVNRLYVKIGQEAIIKDRSIKDVILDRQKRNVDHLKIEEINSISKLNSKLSF